VHKSLEILSQYFGYKYFRPGQELVIDTILKGKDCLAIMPTGGGKSICYQIPALLLDGTCLVISPLIALMNDQAESLANKNISVVNLGGISSRKDIDRLSNNWLKHPPKFIFISPERLNNYLVLERLKMLNMNSIVFDEAHCISHWGHQFRPHYRKVGSIKNHWPTTPFLALTATATPFVQQDIIDTLSLKDVVVHQGDFLRPNLRFTLQESQEKSQLVKHWCKNTYGSKIIYLHRRKHTENYAQYLTNEGVLAKAFHAGLSLSEKSNNSTAWIQNKINTICATSAFGMGIDKPDVRLVINPFLSNTPEDLYQEAGRAGRDGEPALALAFYNQNDVETLKKQLVTNFPINKDLLRQYEILYNTLRIAYNDAPEEGQIYDIEHIAERYNASVTHIHTCLQLLEKEGIVVLNENGRPLAKCQVLLDAKQLHGYCVAHPRYQKLLELLVRAYPGIITSNKSIQMEVIANKLRATESYIDTLLKELHQKDVVNYQEKSSKLLLHIIEGRKKRNENSFKLSNKLREISIQQFAFFEDYISNKTTCRQQMFANYFGTHSDKCRVCDNCLRRDKKLAPTEKNILEFCSEPKNQWQMSVKFPPYILYKTECLQLLNELIEKNKLQYHDGMYFSQPNA
jgi:ATP-dependent DNA helicase RecQ